MKTLLLAFCALIITTGASAQAKKVTEAIKFKEVKYDFGKIKQNVAVTHDFAFTNVGNKPVVVESATASCGCTTPKWPTVPVVKSKSDKITAGFNAATPGPFTKTITVKLAGYDQPVELEIVGEVLTPEAYVKYKSGKDKKTSK